MQVLHEAMDRQIDRRKHRLNHAHMHRNTSRMWDLIAAVVEEANIEVHGLKDAAATKMRGRSRITVKKRNKSILDGIDQLDQSAESASRANWLRAVAGTHARMGNRLVNIARRMKISLFPGRQSHQKKNNV